MVGPSLNSKMGVAETIIFCVVILQGAWCEEWPISLPENIEALSGSCVTINCTFTIDNKYDKDLTDRAAGVWYKDGTKEDNIVFNSSKSNLSLKGNITGKLKDKDCTTIFYNVTSNHRGQFFFRIEGNGELKWTYSQKSVSIDVIDSPPKPTVQMFKDQMEVEVQEVLEESSVCLRCSAKTLCSSSPPTLTWSSTDRLHLNESSRLQLDQQKQTEIISDLNFTATHLQHGVTFICTITYQLQQRNKTAQRNITLHVQYSPKNTSVSVSPSNSVLEGSSVTLICNSDGNPAVFNYTWYRENEGQLEELQTGYNLTFNVTDRTHTGRYYCQARNQHGTQNTSVLLDIQYAPKNTSVSVFPSNSVLEGSSVTLICSSDGNPAVLNYTWYRENEGQLQTGYNLTFNVTDRTHTGCYYCKARNQHGTQNTSVLLDIQYAPQISDSFSCTHGDVKVFSCEVHGNPSPKVEWHLSGRPVSNSTNTIISEERLSSTDLRSFITLHQSLTHTDTLQCVTNNTHGDTSIEFHLFQDTAWFNMNSLLVGLAVGALVTAILCLTIYMYNRWICWTGREDTTGLILNDKAILQENDEPVYANKVMQSPAGDTTRNYPESLNYSSIDFKNNTTTSGENRGASSIVTDYAVVKHVGNTVLGADIDIQRAESKSSNKSAPDNADLYAKVQHHHS